MDKSDPFIRVIHYYERQYAETGNDGFYLLLAVDLCVATGRATPVWAANAFCHGLTSWLLHQSKTLDEALNAKRPKLARNVGTGEHFQARRRRERLRPKIILRVWQRHVQDGEPIDEELFKKIARETGAGLTFVREVYYEPESHALRKVFGLLMTGSGKGESKSPVSVANRGRNPTSRKSGSKSD